MPKNKTLNKVQLGTAFFVQIFLIAAWAEGSNLQIDLGKYQEMVFSYNMEEKDSLDLFNGHSKSIRNLKIVNVLSGRKIMSILELRTNQSTNISFPRGIYVIYFDLIDDNGKSLSQRFQIKVNHPTII